MEVFKIFAIDEEGEDNPDEDQEFEVDPAKVTLETIRQKIADTQLLSNNPDKVTLIKRGKDEDDEEEMENLHQTLLDALGEGESLRFFVEPFARHSVKIKLLVETKAIEWIANQTKEFKFLIGNAKDYKVPYKTNFCLDIYFSNIVCSRNFHLTKVKQSSLWSRRVGGDFQHKPKLP